MYKHILLPTDGSILSELAVREAIAFAKDAGAAITGIHVIPQLKPEQLQVWLHHDAGYAERQRMLFRKIAEEYLAFIISHAQESAVPCFCKVVVADEPYQAIIETARNEKCDLIMMASHGKKGIAALLLGSETLKVLLHSHLPVLVCKPAAQV